MDTILTIYEPLQALVLNKIKSTDISKTCQKVYEFLILVSETHIHFVIKLL